MLHEQRFSIEEKIHSILLEQGNLDAVIPFLKAGALTPSLQQRLANLLSGDPSQDYRVEVKLRAGLHEKHTRKFRLFEDARSLAIAEMVAELIREGKAPKQAYGLAADQSQISGELAGEFGISDALVKKFKFSAKTAERAYLRWRGRYETREM